MDFQIELTDFPSLVHKNIHCHARGVVPLSRSLASVDDAAMRASCEAYHGFYCAMLSDMYDSPEAYALPVGVLEEYLDGKKINGIKQEAPSKTKTLLAQMRNSVNGYVTLLWLLGHRGALNGDVLIVSPEDMRDIAKRVSTSISPIPLEQRLDALARVGLIRGEGGFVSERYPKMFSAMRALATRSDKLSGFDFFAFAAADFRNLMDKHKPNHEDYFYPLIERQRADAYTLHDFALQSGLKASISTFYKVEYKYKGAQVMCVGSQGDCERLLDVRITVAYNWDDHDAANVRLALESPSFQKEALRHVLRCDACSTSHLGRFVTVLGRRARVCGGGMIGFRWRNPTGQDIENIQRMIAIRMALIDDMKDKNARVGEDRGA